MSNPDDRQVIGPEHVLAWMDGELTADEAELFEARLATDPAFMESAAAIARSERVLAQHFAMRERAVASRYIRPGPVHLAAAAAFVLTAFMLFLGGRDGPSGPPFSVAALISEASLARWQAALGVDPVRISPQGVNMRGNPTSRESKIPARDFVRLMRPIELRAGYDAIASEVRSIEGTFFRLPLIVPVLSHVVVYEVRADTTVRRIWPKPNDSGVLEPGVLHVLPAPAIELRDSGTDFERIEYDPGFVLERGVLRVEVVVGVIESAGRGRSMRHETAVLQCQSAAAIARVLQDYGFAVARIQVSEGDS